MLPRAVGPTVIFKLTVYSVPKQWNTSNSFFRRALRVEVVTSIFVVGMNQLFVVNDSQPRLRGIIASLIHSRHSRDNLFSHLRGKIIEITRRATKHGQIKRLL